ncbi:hypothetical protein [Aurantimonas sp. C2-3-R2]|uniref:hypothetical protein n=1 Tax=unclassified Aurantimonas TaxID=2638230 RepID=UPI003FA44F99
MYHAPRKGWLAWVADEDRLVAWDGSAWTVASGETFNSVPLVGVNATADADNRLTVSSPASLFNHPCCCAACSRPRPIFATPTPAGRRVDSSAKCNTRKSLRCIAFPPTLPEKVRIYGDSRLGRRWHCVSKAWDCR